MGDLDSRGDAFPRHDMKTILKLAGIVVGVLVVISIGLFFLMVQPGTSGVVAALRLPDGSEYMVTQHCNWSLEPYSVAFYMRTADGPWGWCYIDHQADRWRNVSMTYDQSSDIITVKERGTWQAALDRKRGVFSIGDGKPERDVKAPEEIQQPEFAFPMASSR